MSTGNRYVREFAHKHENRKTSLNLKTVKKKNHKLSLKLPGGSVYKSWKEWRILDTIKCDQSICFVWIISYRSNDLATKSRTFVKKSRRGLKHYVLSLNQLFFLTHFQVLPVSPLDFLFIKS